MYYVSEVDVAGEWDLAFEVAEGDDVVSVTAGERGCDVNVKLTVTEALHAMACLADAVAAAVANNDPEAEAEAAQEAYANRY